MKTKALILGAKPSLFEGPWVSISEAERWAARARTAPIDVDLTDCVMIEVEGSPRVSHPFENGLEIAGHRARVVIAKELEDCDSLSITLEAI